MKVTLFRFGKGTALKLELDMDFAPYPGLVFQGNNPFQVSVTAEQVKYDIPNKEIKVIVEDIIVTKEIEYMLNDGWIALD